MRVLFATAELRPLVAVGGLGEAAHGLGRALVDHDVEVITALPAYEPWPLVDETVVDVARPDWAHLGDIRLGHHEAVGRLAVVDGPGIGRPDPYVDERGEGWADNDLRFAAFSASVAGLASALDVDLVHLNDWHTGLAPAFLDQDRPTVLTIHNLAHQGWANLGWIDQLPRHRSAYVRGDAINALAGAIQVVDRVVAVSPTYAAEIVTPVDGMGLDDLLGARGDGLRGIINGIDTGVWDPATDAYAPNFDLDHLDRKGAARRALLDRVGWDDDGKPLLVMVTRLVDQKGVDLALSIVPLLAGMGARLLLLGSGQEDLTADAHRLAEDHPSTFWFYDGYDGPLSHLLFAGGDLFLMPSRFEPCGLSQMQAMAYGTIPIATPVGGLVDTVIDDDTSAEGNGFLALAVDEMSVVDAVHRALRAMRHHRRRRALQRRGMARDWSWATPAAHYAQLYRDVVAAQG